MLLEFYKLPVIQAFDGIFFFYFSSSPWGFLLFLLNVIWSDSRGPFEIDRGTASKIAGYIHQE